MMDPNRFVDVWTSPTTCGARNFGNSSLQWRPNDRHIRHLRCVDALVGHAGCVNRMTWSQSGDKLATVSDDTQLIVWGRGAGYEEQLFGKTNRAGNRHAYGWQGGLDAFGDAAGSSAADTQRPGSTHSPGRPHGAASSAAARARNHDAAAGHCWDDAGSWGCGPMTAGAGWRLRPIAKVDTGHAANIFGVKFLSYTNDTAVVTGGMDGEVRLHTFSLHGAINNGSGGGGGSCISGGAGRSPPEPAAAGLRSPRARMLLGRSPTFDLDGNEGGHSISAGWSSTLIYEHRSRVKVVESCPDSPFIFWSGAEDGTVCQFDTREFPAASASADRNSASDAGLANSSGGRPLYPASSRNVLISLRVRPTTASTTSGSSGQSSPLGGHDHHDIDLRTAAAAATQHLRRDRAPAARVSYTQVKYMCVSQTNPNHMLLACGDQYLRLYDRRMLPSLWRGHTGLLGHDWSFHDASEANRNVLRFAPLHMCAGHSLSHLYRSDADSEVPLPSQKRKALWAHATHASFDPSGRYIAGTYHGDGCYVFDVGACSDVGHEISSFGDGCEIWSGGDDGYDAVGAAGRGGAGGSGGSVSAFGRMFGGRQGGAASSSMVAADDDDNDGDGVAAVTAGDHGGSNGVSYADTFPRRKTTITLPPQPDVATSGFRLGGDRNNTRRAAGAGDGASDSPPPLVHWQLHRPALCARASQLKDAGNDAFKAGKWFEAIVCYSKAIETGRADWHVQKHRAEDDEITAAAVALTARSQVEDANAADALTGAAPSAAPSSDEESDASSETEFAPQGIIGPTNAAGIALLLGNRAMAYLRRGGPGDASSAVADCDEAIGLSPLYWKVSVRMCRALKAAGQLHLAYAHLRHFISQFNREMDAGPAATTSGLEAASQQQQHGTGWPSAAQLQPPPSVLLRLLLQSADHRDEWSVVTDDARVLAEQMREEIMEAHAADHPPPRPAAPISTPASPAASHRPETAAAGARPSGRQAWLRSDDASDEDEDGASGDESTDQSSDIEDESSAEGDEEAETDGEGEGESGTTTIEVDIEVDRETAARVLGDVSASIAEAGANLATASGHGLQSASNATGRAEPTVTVVVAPNEDEDGQPDSDTDVDAMGTGEGSAGDDTRATTPSQASGSTGREATAAEAPRNRPEVPKCQLRVNKRWNAHPRYLRVEATGDSTSAKGNGSSAGEPSHKVANRPDAFDDEALDREDRSMLCYRHTARLVGHSNVQTDIKEAHFWGVPCGLAGAMGDVGWSRAMLERASGAASGVRSHRAEDDDDEADRSHDVTSGILTGRCGYIVAGSDCGNAWIYDIATSLPVGVIGADDDVCNAVQPHPYLPLLATSGIESTVRLWAPVVPVPEVAPVEASSSMAVPTAGATSGATTASTAGASDAESAPASTAAGQRSASGRRRAHGVESGVGAHTPERSRALIHSGMDALMAVGERNMDRMRTSDTGMRIPLSLVRRLLMSMHGDRGQGPGAAVAGEGEGDDAARAGVAGTGTPGARVRVRMPTGGTGTEAGGTEAEEEEADDDDDSGGAPECRVT